MMQEIGEGPVQLWLQATAILDTDGAASGATGDNGTFSVEISEI
jgi:hypothetical protein